MNSQNKIWWTPEKVRKSFKRFSIYYNIQFCLILILTKPILNYLMNNIFKNFFLLSRDYLEKNLEQNLK